VAVGLFYRNPHAKKGMIEDSHRYQLDKGVEERKDKNALYRSVHGMVRQNRLGWRDFFV